ncbi:hypothetical protein RHSIM_Rhsim08G0148700 [Rhododendron simsii]|uniref:DUF4283 domain-containing protein n=1 Tax=Rhododendron simsii TaxID=118357 RepID=A0A834GLJ1_RHOSS|nr:hypothetical protein RHSIM_Rhsim08G0148700 [Rhododendron simsii]
MDVLSPLSVSLGNFPPLCFPVRVSPNPKDPSVISGILTEGLLLPGSIPTDPRSECSDDSMARQIKTLTSENLVLRQKAEDSFSMVLLDSNSSLLSFVPVGKPISPTSWKDIVASVNPLISRMNLHYCPPALENNDLHVNILESFVGAGVDRWKDWVVGYFVDRKLHFTAVETTARKIWDPFGLLDMLSNEDGFFFFYFDQSTLEAGDLSLALGILGASLCSGLKRLSHVASAIGKPFFADHLTESCKRISYAKICVEVDASVPLPESFGLSSPSEAKFTIRVWYPWKPIMCESCHVFGHQNCHLKPVASKPMLPKQQVWVAKTTGENALPFTHAIVSSSIVDDSAGASAAVASVLSPAVVSGKGDPVLEILQRSLFWWISIFRSKSYFQGLWK